MAGIVNEAINFAVASSVTASPEVCICWCLAKCFDCIGKDFGSRFCLDESVVFESRSLSAFSAICRRRSMFCGSMTPGMVTLTDVNVVGICGDCGRITPTRKQHRCTGFTIMLIIGCRTFGKKLTNFM